MDHIKPEIDSSDWHPLRHMVSSCGVDAEIIVTSAGQSSFNFGERTRSGFVRSIDRGVALAVLVHQPAPPIAEVNPPRTDSISPAR
jgi:hypothetical protein